MLNSGCIHVVYPGDTNMDAIVDINDIYPIVNYWGGEMAGTRPMTDVDGKKINSRYDWIAQGSLMNAGPECMAYADANGDGRINISDITTVYMNLGKQHDYSTNTNCISLARESDIDIYYSIFQSLPYGELKISLANKYGFEIPPQSFSVHPNYPNPFNPITTIKYEIPIKGNITIQISNLYGQQVVEYKEIGVKSGYYSYTWDASDYSSGIYFFSIIFNNALINSQKIILIK